MNVVLDTNVWISGIFWKGPSHDIVKMAERGTAELHATQDMIDELFGVLQREKFSPLFSAAETSFREVSRHVLSLVKVHPSVEPVNAIKEDPTDNKFLACALAVRASFVVSGDAHLLDLKEWRGIDILAPHAFLEALAAA